MAMLFAVTLLASPASAIEFAPSIEAARKTNDKPLPIVLTFTSPSCGWCRKLEVSTFADESVATVAEAFLWVKVDTEDQPALAAKLRVRGVPHTFVLDGEDRVIGSQPGYMPPEQFLKFLLASLENPQQLDDVPQDLLDRIGKLGESDDRHAVVTQVVERLAKQDAEGRELLVTALTQSGEVTTVELAKLLGDERLSIRAAANGLLREVSECDLPFDPFADTPTRQQQQRAITEWIEKHTPTATPASEPNS